MSAKYWNAIAQEFQWLSRAEQKKALRAAEVFRAPADALRIMRDPIGSAHNATWADIAERVAQHGDSTRRGSQPNFWALQNLEEIVSAGDPPPADTVLADLIAERRRVAESTGWTFEVAEVSATAAIVLLTRPGGEKRIRLGVKEDGTTFRELA